MHVVRLLAALGCTWNVSPILFSCAFLLAESRFWAERLWCDADCWTWHTCAGGRQILHAKQSVQHLQLDRKSATMELLATVSRFVDGGIKLAVAVVAHNVDNVWTALKCLNEAFKKAKGGSEGWYGVVRLLEDLPPDQLCEFVDPTSRTIGDGHTGGRPDTSSAGRTSRLSEEKYNETVTFFVVELLDAIARTRDVSDVTTSESLVRGDATADALLRRVAAKPLPRARAIKLLAMVFKGQCPHLPAASRPLRAHILLALKRLCQLPSNPALVVVAQTTVKDLFHHLDVKSESCWGNWKRLWCSCVKQVEPKPVTPTLTVGAGGHTESILPSAESVNFLVPQVRPSRANFWFCSCYHNP